MTDEQQNSVTPEHLEKVAHQRPFSRSAMKAWLLHAAEALREAQDRAERERYRRVSAENEANFVKAERDRLAEENRRLRDVLQRVENTHQLWLPKYAPPEHLGKAEALHQLRAMVLRALSQPNEEN